MANDIGIRVTVDNQTAKGFAAVRVAARRLKANVEDLGRSSTSALSTLDTSAQRSAAGARRLSGALMAVAEAGTEAGRTSLAPLTRDIDQAADAAHGLRRSLLNVQREAEDLNRTSVRVKVDVDSDTSRLGSIKSSVSKLRDSASSALSAGAKVGSEFASGLTQAVKAGTSALPDQVKAVLVGTVAVAAMTAAPLIGAALATGVQLGFGGGALAAGIAAAVQDPAVAQEAGYLGNQLKEQFKAAGSVFRGPVLDAIRYVASEAKSLDIGGVLAPMAEQIKPLTAGLMGLVKGALPGIKQGVAEAAPLFTHLASLMPELGAAIGDFARSIGGASGGTKALVTDVMDFASSSIRALGDVIGFLGAFYEKARAFNAWLDDHNPVLKFVESVGLIDESSQGLTSVTSAVTAVSDKYASSLEDIEEAAKAAARAQLDAMRAADALSNSWRSSFDASVALEQSYDDLTASVSEHGKTLDITTQKGRDNISVLESGIDAAVRAGQAERDRAVMEGDLAGATARGNAVRDAAVAKIREHAAALGYNKAQVDALIRSMLGLPTGERTLDYKVRVTVYGNATPAQINNLARLQAKGMSEGGPVEEGSGIRDDVPRTLMRGEHVLTKDEVTAMGGQSAVARFRRALTSGGSAAPAGASSSTSGGSAQTGGGTTTVLLGSDGSPLGDVLLSIIAIAVRGQGGDPATLGIKI